MQSLDGRGRSAAAGWGAAWKGLGSGVLCLSLGLGCAGGGRSSGGAGGGDPLGNVLQELKGTAVRVQATAASPSSASSDAWAFGWKLYAAQATPADNVVFSPYSISAALAMLVGGAAGPTKTEIEQALDFSTEGEAFNRSQDALALALAARNHGGTDAQTQSLRVSNGLWLAPGFEPSKDYLNTLSAYYGASVYRAPFPTQPEQARQAINQRVSNDTEQRIPELLPVDSLNELTRVVLTNALYLQSNWQTRFAGETADAAFQAQSGVAVNVPMMHQVIDTPYVARPGYEVLALPYAGGELEFIALMPTAGTFDDFVTHLDAQTVSAALAALDRSHIALAFPKFKFEYRLPLRELLEGLGMTTAFTQAADLSGIAPDQLEVSGVFHDATIDVDESGTRAAAATSVVIELESVPQPVSFDHPFVFFIRDVPTNALLFVGQYANP